MLTILVLCITILHSCAGDVHVIHDISPKIINGLPVSISQVTYQASLRLTAIERTQGFGYGHVCGGSIITQRVILTAAHCVVTNNGHSTKDRSAGEFTIVLGSESLFLKGSHTLRYYVQEIVKHAQFNRESLVNDIALMFINGYIPWQWPTARAIQLNTREIPDDTICIISGWGKRENGKISRTLMAAMVPIISRTRCTEDFAKLPHGMMCAGYLEIGGVDACQGDSGGPLACDGLLGGITSWGVGCAQPHSPGVYTNISDYIHWIEEKNSTFNYTLFRNSAISLRVSLFMIILVLLSLSISSEII